MIALISDSMAQIKPSMGQYINGENLAVNGGFEQGKKGWTNSAGTFSTDLTKNVEGKKAGCIDLTAQTLDFSQTLSTGYNSNLDKMQGLVFAYVRSDFDGVEVCGLVDGSEVGCRTVGSDSRYSDYSIPVIMGSSSIGIKLKTSGNVTGEVCLDGARFGTKKISQVSNICSDDITCKNSFTARILGSNGSVISKSADFINTSSRSGVGTYPVTFKNLNLTTNPTFSLSINDGAGNCDGGVRVFSISTTGATFQTKDDTGGNQDCSFTFEINRQDEDVVKVEEIVTQAQKVCQVSASGNGAGTISQDTEDIGWSTETKDNCDAWGDSGNTGTLENDTYTAQKTGMILVSGVVSSTAANTNPIVAYVNNNLFQRCNQWTTNFTRNAFSCLLDVEEGQAVRFRVTSSNINLVNNSFHKINITEILGSANVIGRIKETMITPETSNSVYCSVNVGGATEFSDCTTTNCNKYQEKGDCGLSFSHAGTGSVSVSWDTSKIEGATCGFTARAFSAATNAYASWGGYSSTGATIRCRRGSDNSNVDCFYSFWCSGVKP